LYFTLYIIIFFILLKINTSELEGHLAKVAP
jgi:hypothetical protein